MLIKTQTFVLVSRLRVMLHLIQTRPMMVKQLQCSLAAAPAILTYYALSITGWMVLFILQLARLVIQHLFGGRMHKISTKFSNHMV